MKYKIELTETYKKVIEVDAGSLSTAITQVAKDYHSGKVKPTEFTYKIKEYKEDKQ